MPSPSEEVAQSLAAARAGSQEALGAALEACRAYLLLIARQELDPMLRAKGGASDLVQETFLEAQRDFAQFQGTAEEELKAWLRRLLLNNLANFVRRYRQTAKRQAECEVSLEATASSAQGAGRLADEGPSPSDKALARERDEVVHRALDRLPEDYRLVLLLRYEDGCSFEEIAAQLGRSPNASQKLFARALERLQQEFGGAP
jgi:RNA polymerase sigma-70 factor (ECF subfamily)